MTNQMAKFNKRREEEVKARCTHLAKVNLSKDAPIEQVETSFGAEVVYENILNWDESGSAACYANFVQDELLVEVGSVVNREGEVIMLFRSYYKEWKKVERPPYSNYVADYFYSYDHRKRGENQKSFI